MTKRTKIIQLITTKIPDAEVEILNPLDNEMYLQCVVTAPSLAKLSRIERQRKINDAVKEMLDSEELHSLGIRIKIKK